MHVYAIPNRRFSPPGAATGGVHSLAVLIPHSRSGAVHTTSLRGYRRPAHLNSSLGFGSVAIHFIRAGAFERCRPHFTSCSPDHLARQSIDPAKSHLQVLCSAHRDETNRSERQEEACPLNRGMRFPK